MPVHNESLIDSPVMPGDTVTYSWLVQSDQGPAVDDISTVAYVYASNVDAKGNLNAGLFGAIIVSSPVIPFSLCTLDISAFPVFFKIKLEDFSCILKIKNCTTLS